MKPVLSPLQKPVDDAPVITKEQTAKIAEMLGAEAIFIVAQTRAHKDCSPSTCMGHYMFMRCQGFTEPQIRGIGDTILNDPEPIPNENDK